MPKLKSKPKDGLYIALGVVIFLGLLSLFVFSKDNLALMKSVFLEDLSQDELKAKFDVFNWHDYVTIITLAALQVVCTFLPAEPVQVLSGLSFGFGIGLLCCLAGVLLGSSVIFLLQKSFHHGLRGFFVKKLGLDLEKIAQSGSCVALIFLLYFLPAIPYGAICFLAASTGMRYRRYITVTLLGALPSVCIGVGLGYMTIVSDRSVSLCVFAGLMVLLIIGLCNRKTLFAKFNRYVEAEAAKSKGPKVNGFVMGIIYFALRIYYFFCGIRVKAVNKVGAPERPAIVLCNHGSFIDFIFAATLLRKYKPNFVVARLYFYDRVLGWLLKTIGAFPKSMFALDTESTKNCLRVLKGNGILAMMPEARLATAGRFEDIQPGTYSFLKKAGVTVYTVKFGGDYLADPKWGKGFRRGAVVEAELDILFTKEQIRQLSVEDIQAGVEERLRYNDFAWLEKHPHIRYRSPRMAEGLENILTVCPVCRQKHTVITKKDRIFCENCGYLTSLDCRYLFTGDFQFRDLTQWYDWQLSLLKKEIAAKADFALSSPVELRLPSNGRGLTRHGGYGTCTLNRDGLIYRGTKDGEPVELHFPLDRIYRLLFGAGVNFELYNGTEILFFVPQEKRSNIDWYMASMVLYDESTKEGALN